MRFQDKVEALIGRLAQSTVEGDLEWRVGNPPSGLVDGSEEKYPLYLSTVLKGKTIGLYSRKFRVWHGELDFHWDDGMGLCLTEGSKVLWEYNSDTPGLRNLLKVAREQASGVVELIDDLLGSAI